ncbi:MAG: heavy metal translocating P-type ATPase [Planctomycetota bacterium]|nr:heavy metal translocating P-type ATPase [Planctomycetota bacterium]
MAQARCTLRVHGLDCPGEVPAIRAALDGVSGISELGFDPIHGTVTIAFDPGRIDPPLLARRVTEGSGMRADVVGDDEVAAGPKRSLARWMPTLGSGLAVALGSILSWLDTPPWAAKSAFALAIAFGGLELVPRAIRGLRQMRLDIHVLMALAVAGALVLNQWDEAAAVAFLFSLSEALEALSLDRARRAVRSLLEITPETAERIEPNGHVHQVPASSILVGQRVRVRAGERVTVDGRVVAGRSSVDQKMITGESIPVLREEGDEVFAGTVNGEGALDIEATRPLGDAVVSRIAERVRAAQKGRAPVERSIERFAAIYTPAVVVLALLVMIVPPLIVGGSWAAWFAKGLVLLVIACPCALVIATPVAVVSALASAARRGILIKGGQFLEEFGRLRVLAFDKTGTLTRGEPDVIEVVAADGREDGELLRIAAALGDRGGHVLGRAIARHARRLALDVPEAHDYRAVPGLGATGRVETTEYHIGSHRYIDESGLCPPEFHASFLRAEGAIGTSVALTSSANALGWIRLADRPRPEAAAVLAELKALRVEPIMLTGDNGPTAAAIARELGIAAPQSDLLPADKAEAIAVLNAQRGPTGMVGDGVNDAPALAAARVSVAMGGIGSGAALETADVVLMADDLTALPWLVRHSRRTLAVIRQNIVLAISAKAVVLFLAFFGLANLWMAIAADLGVSLVVVANALRLLRAGEGRAITRRKSTA